MLAPLFLAAGAALSPEPAAAAGEAQVQLLRGRGELFGPQGRSELERRRSITSHAGAVLTIEPGSEARVTWVGRASLTVEGPAELEWSPSWSDGQGLTWRVRRAGRLRLEVRRGGCRLEFPTADANFEVGRCAVSARSLPGGEFELRNEAGQPLLTAGPPLRAGRTRRLRAVYSAPWM